MFDLLAADVRPTANWYKNYNMEEFKPATPKGVGGTTRTWLTRGKQNTGRSFMAFEHPSDLGAGTAASSTFPVPPRGRPLLEASNTPYIRQVLPHMKS